jgi:hypothetical protein
MTTTDWKLRVALVLVAAAAIGCGNDTATTGGDDNTDDNTDEPDPDPFPKPESGEQITSGQHNLAANEEKTFCVVTALTSETDIPVVKLESYNSGFTHHYIVFKSNDAIAPGSGECPKNLFTGAPPIYPGTRDQGAFAMPEGVALPLKAKQTIIMQIHLLNPTDEPVVEELKINFHAGTNPIGTYEKAGVLGGADLNFEIPPNKMHTETQYCGIGGVKNLFALTSHAHSRMLSFDVKRAEGPIYHNESWSEPNVEQYAPALEMGTLDYLVFSCTWFNETSTPIKYGETANDEMCMFFGYFYPSAADVAPCLGL